MTSEVVVMNRLAVALAADSASTVSGPRSQKIWNSANKLFALSKYRPVGVMVYNNASILGVPWETIIKTYRASLGSAGFNTLEEYGQDFLRFLNGNNAMFSRASQDRYFLELFAAQLWRLKESADSKYVESLMQKEQSTRSQKFLEMVDQEIARLNEVPDLETSPAHTSEAIYRELGDQINIQIDRSLEELDVNENLREKLGSLAVMLITKNDFGTNYTGLVFAGFGEVEHFPVMQSFQVGGMILDSLKQTAPNIRKVSDDEPSILEPFAQSEMVTTFLEGINPRLRRELARLFIGLALELPDTVIDAITDLQDEQKTHWKGQVRPHAANAIRTMLETLQEHADEKYWGPVHDALIHLPKDELAHVAEALVNLNSFQKKVSMDDETVGGPIDVAVISKGDGLVWIKRKHYFPRELNEHYFNNLRSI